MFRSGRQPDALVPSPAKNVPPLHQDRAGATFGRRGPTYASPPNAPLAISGVPHGVPLGRRQAGEFWRKTGIDGRLTIRTPHLTDFPFPACFSLGCKGPGSGKREAGDERRGTLGRTSLHEMSIRGFPPFVRLPSPVSRSLPIPARSCTLPRQLGVRRHRARERIVGRHRRRPSAQRVAL